MKYFNQPPKYSMRYGNIPEFMKKWYAPKRPTLSLKYVLSLISWAEKEFSDIFNYCIAQNNEKAVRAIKQVDCLYFLAQTKEFSQFVSYIKDDHEMWDSYPKTVQDTLIKVYRHYSATKT
jgi:hypothetical protein